MPTSIVPMAATLAAEPFDNKDWVFEIKQDGYRIIAYIGHGRVKLQTRNLIDYTSKFPAIVKDLQKWQHNAVIDGEVVVLNQNGVSDFDALINWKATSGVPVYYYVFDLLWLDGKDYMSLPLHKRKSALKSLMPRSRFVRYQTEIRTYGMAAFKMAEENNLEGIIAKKRDSIYQPGKRSKDWLKLKTYKVGEFAICGYTKNVGGPAIATLILGTYSEDKLQFAGEVSGFSEKTAKEILANIRLVKKSPFFKDPKLTSRWRKKRSRILCSGAGQL